MGNQPFWFKVKYCRQNILQPVRCQVHEEISTISIQCNIISQTKWWMATSFKYRVIITNTMNTNLSENKSVALSHWVTNVADNAICLIRSLSVRRTFQRFIDTSEIWINRNIVKIQNKLLKIAFQLPFNYEKQHSGQVLPCCKCQSGPP